jgi:hypothetical protein
MSGVRVSDRVSNKGDSAAGKTGSGGLPKRLSRSDKFWASFGDTESYTIRPSFRAGRKSFGIIKHDRD